MYPFDAKHLGVDAPKQVIDFKPVLTEHEMHDDDDGEPGSGTDSTHYSGFELLMYLELSKHLKNFGIVCRKHPWHKIEASSSKWLDMLKLCPQLQVQ